MIKRLRRKFIIVNMVIVTVMLTIIFGLILFFIFIYALFFLCSINSIILLKFTFDIFYSTPPFIKL